MLVFIIALFISGLCLFLYGLYQFVQWQKENRIREQREIQLMQRRRQNQLKYRRKYN